MCDSDSGLSISMNGSNKDIDTSLSSPTVIKISVPSVNVEVSDTYLNTVVPLKKVYSFLSTNIVSDVKLSIATDLNLEFRDILNYGLFLPPANGKAGKFLQEDRQLKDYPFSCSVGHLEVCCFSF